MNTIHQKLTSKILKYIPLNEVDIQTISNDFESIIVSKNTMLEVENKPTKYLYFIIEGYVRVFYIIDGEERTTQINCPSGFITSFQSFITNTTAYDNVQTISECHLLRITKDKLDKLNESVKDWGIFGEK